MPKIKLPIFLDRFNTKGNKRKLLGLALVALVALVGFAVWSNFADKLKDDKKIYAEAAGHKIYEEEIRDFLGENTQGVSEHDAATVLADKYLVESLAKERGVTVTDEELVASYDKDTLKQKDTFKYAYQNKLNQVYLSKLGAQNEGVYKGKFLIANFSQNVQAYPTLPEDKANNPDLGNPKAITKDKKYAENFITDLYNKITSGQITFDQAIKMEHEDSRVGLEAYPELAHSDSFDTTFRSRDILNSPSIREKINSIKAGETTEPFVVRVNNSLADSNSTAESYFLVVHMDETSGSYTGMDFTQYLKLAKERLGYKINV
jgi:hypothetical protein